MPATIVPFRHLFGPGPTNPYPEATLALSRPLLGHLDPAFIAAMDHSCEGLRQVWGTSNARTLPLSATGLPAWAAFVNTSTWGRGRHRRQRAVRRADVRRARQAEVVRVDFEWGTLVDDRLAAAHPILRSSRPCMPRPDRGAPTSPRSGPSVTPVVGGRGHLDRRHRVAGRCWGIDVGYAGTQKCLGGAGAGAIHHQRAPGSAAWQSRSRGTRPRHARRLRWWAAVRTHLPPHRTGWDGESLAAALDRSSRGLADGLATRRPALRCRPAQEMGLELSPPRATGCRSSPRSRCPMGWIRPVRGCSTGTTSRSALVSSSTRLGLADRTNGPER